MAEVLRESCGRERGAIQLALDDRDDAAVGALGHKLAFDEAQVGNGGPRAAIEEPRAQDAQAVPIDHRECARIGRRDRAHEVVHFLRAASPVDAPVLGLAAAEIRSLCEVLRLELGLPRDELRQRSVEHDLGGDRHLAEDIHGAIVGKDRYCELVDDAARIGLRHHLVERRSGRALPAEHRPVDGRAPAIFR